MIESNRWRHYLEPEGEGLLEYPSDSFAFALRLAYELRDKVRAGADMDEQKRLDRLQLFLEMLSDWSGQAFGDNVEAYARWFADHQRNWQEFSRPEEMPSDLPFKLI